MFHNFINLFFNKYSIPFEHYHYHKSSSNQNINLVNFILFYFIFYPFFIIKIMLFPFLNIPMFIFILLITFFAENSNLLMFYQYLNVFYNDQKHYLHYLIISWKLKMLAFIIYLILHWILYEAYQVLQVSPHFVF